MIDHTNRLTESPRQMLGHDHASHCRSLSTSRIPNFKDFLPHKSCFEHCHENRTLYLELAREVTISPELWVPKRLPLNTDDFLDGGLCRMSSSCFTSRPSESFLYSCKNPAGSRCSTLRYQAGVAKFLQGKRECQCSLWHA